MRKIIFVIMFTIIGLSVKGQVTFQKTYKGIYHGVNSKSVQKTSDGGYIIGGNTDSTGGINDGYLIKTNANGDTLWTKGFGGNMSTFYSVVQTNDGGYIAIGTVYLLNGEISIIKMDSYGNPLWTKYLSGNGEDMISTSILQTSNSEYTIIGWNQLTTGNNLFLVKLDSSDTFIWNNGFGVWQTSTLPTSMQETSDGGYVIAGHSDYGTFLSKTDNVGNLVWVNTYSVNGNPCDFYSVIQTNDGGFAVVGRTSNNPSLYFLKTDGNGNVIFSKTFGGSLDDEAYSVKQTTDGGYIISGYTNSFGAGNYDVYLIKTDNIGNIIFSKTYGGMRTNQANTVQQTLDGGYVIVGNSTSFSLDSSNEIYLIKTDSLGNSSCNETNPVTISSTPITVATSIPLYGIITSIASFPTSFNIESGGSVNNLCITTSNDEIVNETKNSISLYPNPASGIITFSNNSQLSSRFNRDNSQLIITDVLGSEVYHQLITNNSSLITQIDVSGFSNGMYFYRITSNKETLQGKFVKTN